MRVHWCKEHVMPRLGSPESSEFLWGADPGKYRRQGPVPAGLWRSQGRGVAAPPAQLPAPQYASPPTSVSACGFCLSETHRLSANPLVWDPQSVHRHSNGETAATCKRFPAYFAMLGCLATMHSATHFWPFRMYVRTYTCMK